eukprot:SAG22_NODE_3232_length_1842_cov_4.887550_2_plen_82_part_00
MCTYLTSRSPQLEKDEASLSRASGSTRRCAGRARGMGTFDKSDPLKTGGKKEDQSTTTPNRLLLVKKAPAPKVKTPPGDFC